MDKIGNRFEVQAKLGEGGMGIVYKAYDPFFDRLVAVKAMSAELSAQADFRTRFFREARATGSLNHDHIVKVYDLGEDNGRPYLVMEFLEGRDLKAEVDGGPRLPLEERIRIMREIASGLSCAHQKGIVHRDIKPGNIFLTLSGQVKILDFGLARPVSAATLTTTGQAMGTPSYMSPEQWQAAHVDQRSDLFSAGAVFYELLTGRKAFDGDSYAEIFHKIFNGRPTPVGEIAPAIPAELVRLVGRMLQTDPAARYQNMDEVDRDLAIATTMVEDRKRELRIRVAEATDALQRVLRGTDLLTPGDLARLGVGPGAPRESGGESHADSAAEGATVLSPPEYYLELVAALGLAEHNQEVARALIAKRQRLGPRLREAEDLRESGALEDARELLTVIITEEPLYEAAQELRAEIETEIGKRRETEARESRIRELWPQALSLSRAEDAAGAERLLEEILSLDPSHREARGLFDQVRHRAREVEEIAERQRQADEAYARALSALESGDLTRAKDELEKGRRFDTGSHRLTDTESRIAVAEQEFRKRQERTQRLGVLLEEVQSLARDGQMVSAQTRLEELISLDPHHPPTLALREELLARFETADRARGAARRRKRIVQAAVATLAGAVLLFAGWRYLPGPWRATAADQYGASALEAFRRGDYTEVARTAEVWLSRDAGNNQALELRRQAGKGVEALTAFDAAIRAKTYEPARGALLDMGRLNASDPNAAGRWARFKETFSPERRDDFLGGLGLWNAPKTWAARSGRMVVQGTGLGMLRDSYYDDFEASFNLELGNGKGAVWVLRASPDSQQYYLFQLTGPRGTPPNSFAAFRRTPQGLETAFPPNPLGADLGLKDDQFTVLITARGSTIEHRLEIASAPTEAPFLAGKVVDTAFAAGMFGFGTKDGEEFAVLGFKILPK